MGIRAWPTGGPRPLRFVMFLRPADIPPAWVAEVASYDLAELGMGSLFLAEGRDRTDAAVAALGAMEIYADEYRRELAARCRRRLTV